MEKVLYIYGYGSSPKDSATMKTVKEVMNELGFSVVSMTYDQEDPDMGLIYLEKYIKDHNIKYVIGHSLGGFFALCLSANVKKLVINPCVMPYETLSKVGKFSDDTITMYKCLEGWLMSGSDTPWVSQIDDVMGLFGDKDELFSFYSMFKKQYPRSYIINATHRPTLESFTKDIKEKIKEFFS